MSRFALVSALVLSVVTSGLAQTVLRPEPVVAAAADGWWIRVDPKGTTATRIEWQFGSTPKNLYAKESWERGKPVDMQIPPPLRSGKSLYIRATTAPANSAATVCVFFKQQGAGLFLFRGTEERQVSIDKKEPQCAVAPPIYRVLPHFDDVPSEPAPRVE